MIEVLRQSLRPELLNRIDEVVIFRPLGREQIAQIVEIQLRDLLERLRDRNISLWSWRRLPRSAWQRKGSIRSMARGRCGGQSSRR